MNSTQQFTLRLPEDLARRLAAATPSRKRNQFVVDLVRRELDRESRELEEAAFVDGASRMYTLRRVVLPLAVPGLIVVGVAVFIGAYAQQFLFAITFNNQRELQQ